MDLNSFTVSCPIVAPVSLSVSPVVIHITATWWKTKVFLRILCAFSILVCTSVQKGGVTPLNMCIISSFVISWQFKRIVHNGSKKPYLFCPPGSCRYNSHMMKNERFLANFMRILNSCVIQQVPKCQPVNCPAVALNVFYSTIMRSLMLFQLWNVLT